MHPVLAQYLNIESALQTLDKVSRGESLAKEEGFFAEAAQSDTERQQLVISARGKQRLDEETQAALVILAAHAAVLSVRSDEALGPILARAREALTGEGASIEEAERLLVALVLEEGFGTDAEADAFDQPYFRESLETVPKLAMMDQTKAEELITKVVEQAEDAQWARAHEEVSESLLRAAWEEGLEPIHPEHVDDAVTRAEKTLGPRELPRILESMRRFIAVLAEDGLVGPLRRAKLDNAVNARTLTLGGKGTH